MHSPVFKCLIVVPLVDELSAVVCAQTLWGAIEVCVLEVVDECFILGGEGSEGYIPLSCIYDG